MINKSFFHSIREFESTSKIAIAYYQITFPVVLGNITWHQSSFHYKVALKRIYICLISNLSAYRFSTFQFNSVMVTIVPMDFTRRVSYLFQSDECTKTLLNQHCRNYVASEIFSKFISDLFNIVTLICYYLRCTFSRMCPNISLRRVVTFTTV